MCPAPPAAPSAHTQCSQAPPASWEQHKQLQELGREEEATLGPGRVGVAHVRGCFLCSSNGGQGRT